MIKQTPGVLYWVLSLLLLTFSFQCENPIETTKEDRRVIIVRRECANAAINTTNLFAVCGAGSVDDPFRIVHELQLIHLSDPANQAAAWDATACDGGQCHFKLIDDLNMDGMTLNGPIGTAANPFHTNFDGNTKVISNLTVDFPAIDNVGLFGNIDTGVEIRNLGLVNADITGQNIVGGLVGESDGGAIVNSYMTGSVNGNTNVGGSLGMGTNNAIISNSYVSGSVTGTGNNVGGIAGFRSNVGNITNSYMTGSVTGNSTVGGIVGLNGANADIINSYVTSSVIGNTNVGGLVGRDNFGRTNGTNYFVDTTDSNGGGDGVGNGTYVGREHVHNRA